MSEERYEVIFSFPFASRPSQRTCKLALVTCKTKTEGSDKPLMPARRAVAEVKGPVETQANAQTGRKPPRGDSARGAAKRAHLDGIGRVTTGGTSLASPWPSFAC